MRVCFAFSLTFKLFKPLFGSFQHALAMLAGLITPPIIFSSALNLDGSTQAYMVRF
jgi:xanthine/uracil permease